MTLLWLCLGRAVCAVRSFPYHSAVALMGEMCTVCVCTRRFLIIECGSGRMGVLALSAAFARVCVHVQQCFPSAWHFFPSHARSKE